MNEDIQVQINRLTEQADRLYQQDLYEQAIEIATNACDLAHQYFGENDLVFAETLDNLAVLYCEKGSYADAEPLYRQALEITRKALGEEHPEVATRLNTLAGLYRVMGNYDAAQLCCRQALEIRRNALGLEHPDFAISLNNLAVLYRAMGNYDAAEPLFRQALEIKCLALGSEHPDVATSLNNLAVLYRAMGNYDAAQPLFRQALEIMRKALSEEHPDVATSLSNLAKLYHARGDYAKAEPLYRQALQIRRSALGEEHPDVAISLNDLAVLYDAMGNYAEAEQYCRQALEISCKALGNEHPEVATSLNNLAGLYHARGNYVKAEPLYRQALEIRRNALGKQHPDFAVSLNNLAALYDAMGNYAEAEPLYCQAVEISRNALGEEYPDFATSLNNLAMLYRAMGNYAKAEPLYRQALQIRRNALGEEHPDFAVSLNNLAGLYSKMGNYKVAEQYCCQALEIRRKVLGEEHLDVAISLNDLAGLYRAMGNYDAAEPLYCQAVEISRKALGEQHPDVATNMNNLAVLYRAMGNYDAAAPLYRQSVEISRNALGSEHPDVATNLNNLAVLYYAMNNYDAAEQHCRQALEIRRKALGEEHPDVAISLNNLAVLYGTTSREAEAITLMKQAASIDDQVIGEIFSIGSESDRMAYLKRLQGNLYSFLSLIVQSLYDSCTEVQAGLDLILRRKAIGAEALAAQRDAVLGGRYPHLASRLKKLTQLRMQIGQKTLAGSGSEGLQTHQQLLTEWNHQKEQLEADLARQIPEMNLTQKLRTANRDAVANALPSESVLIEFVRFNPYDFKAVPAQGDLLWEAAHYLAFILPAQEPDNVLLIDLGEAEPIDSMIATFRASITGESELGYRHGRPFPVEHKTGTGNGVALRTKLFDPLKVAIGDRKRLFLSPDGDLSRLPFEVLPTDDGRYLIDEYYISYLSTGRDVLRFEAPSTGQSTAPIVAADPDFDFGDGENTNVPEDTKLLGQQSRDLDRGRWHFGRLPGTRQEGEQIAKMLTVQPWVEQAVLETHLKASRSPRILHIATHGFFLPDQKRDLNKEQFGLGTIGEMSNSGLNRLSGVGLENPLLRSGLALAGANTWLKGNSLPPFAEDGILTAEDVSGLDLLDTELVVLSACETGLGDVHTGEGVFGLRRSFVLAGAKTLVMSLWKVPDKQTQELMEEFYHRVLEGRSRTDALRETQLEMKVKYSDPLYWGAFICQGDPKPLQKHDFRTDT